MVLAAPHQFVREKRMPHRARGNTCRQGEEPTERLRKGFQQNETKAEKLQVYIGED